ARPGCSRAAAPTAAAAAAGRNDDESRGDRGHGHQACPPVPAPHSVPPALLEFARTQSTPSTRLRILATGAVGTLVEGVVPVTAGRSAAVAPAAPPARAPRRRARRPRVGSRGGSVRRPSRTRCGLPRPCHT